MSSFTSIHATPGDMLKLSELVERQIAAMPADGPGFFRIHTPLIPSVPLSKILHQEIESSEMTYHALETEGCWTVMTDPDKAKEKVGDLWSKGIEAHTGPGRRDVGRMGFDQIPGDYLPKGGEQVMYGSEQPFSLLDQFASEFSWQSVECMLDKNKMPGISEPYTYFGTRGAPFRWHLEDFNLVSLNYLIYGAPKVWYTVPMAQNDRLIAALKELSGDSCDTFFRHAAVVTDPRVLREKYGLDVVVAVQYPGDIMVTHPLGFHAGFNLGPNYAESRNYSCAGWEKYTRMAGMCDCHQYPHDNWWAGWEEWAKMGVAYGCESVAPENSREIGEDEIEGWKRVFDPMTQLWSWIGPCNVKSHARKGCPHAQAPRVRANDGDDDDVWDQLQDGLWIPNCRKKEVSDMMAKHKSKKGSNRGSKGGSK